MTDVCEKFRISTEECKQWFEKGFPEGANEDPETDRRDGWEKRLQLHKDVLHIGR